MTDEHVVITVGKLGSGEQTIELEPGELFNETFDGPGYIEVRVPDDTDEDMTVVAGDTTYEQNGDTNNREWDVKDKQCEKCGKRYPFDYTKCPNCGCPNMHA